MRMEFRLEFACVKVKTADGGELRALVLAVAPIPGNNTHIMAGLAFENGAMVTKPILKFEYEIGQIRGVTLVEASDVHAQPTHGLIIPPGMKV